MAEYVVKSGDSLSKIAKANGTTVDELVRLNGIKDANKIQINQKIKLKGDSKGSNEKISESRQANDSAKSKYAKQANDWAMQNPTQVLQNGANYQAMRSALTDDTWNHVMQNGGINVNDASQYNKVPTHIIKNYQQGIHTPTADVARKAAAWGVGGAGAAVAGMAAAPAIVGGAKAAGSALGSGARAIANEAVASGQAMGNMANQTGQAVMANPYGVAGGVAGSYVGGTAVNNEVMDRTGATSVGQYINRETGGAVPAWAGEFANPGSWVGGAVGSAAGNAVNWGVKNAPAVVNNATRAVQQYAAPQVPKINTGAYNKAVESANKTAPQARQAVNRGPQASYQSFQGNKKAGELVKNGRQGYLKEPVEVVNPAQQYAYPGNTYGGIPIFGKETPHGGGRSGGGGAEASWDEQNKGGSVRSKKPIIEVGEPTIEVLPDEVRYEQIRAKLGSPEFQQWFKQQPEGTVQTYNGKDYEIKRGPSKYERTVFDQQGINIPDSTSTVGPQGGWNFTRQLQGAVPVEATRGNEVMSTKGAPMVAPKKQMGGSLNPSIVDHINSMGGDSSFGARKNLWAQKFGQGEYTGSAEQNSQLLTNMRGAPTPEKMQTPQSSVPSVDLQKPNTNFQFNPVSDLQNKVNMFNTSGRSFKVRDAINIPQVSPLQNKINTFNNSGRSIKLKNEIPVNQKGGTVTPQSITGIGMDILKDIGNRFANYANQRQFTADSTNYVNNIQPAIMPGSKGYQAPKPGANYGAKLRDNAPQMNYQNSMDVINRMAKQPTRPEQYQPKYTW